MTESRTTGERFLAAVAPSDPRAAVAPVAIVGVAYDGAVTYRSGARHGPSQVRIASDSIETYCPKLDRDLEDAPPVDFGDLDVAVQGGGEALVEHLRPQVIDLPPRVVAIGGDHLIAFPFLERALQRHRDLQIFHVDAHFDLRDDWEGERYNHSTVLRRVLDLMPGTATLHSWGIRSGLRDEYQLALGDRRMARIPNSAAAGLSRAHALAADQRPVYVTLDIDGIDPGQMPGTGTPEPGGLDYTAVEDALVALVGATVVGADVVECAPNLDPSGITQVACARLVRTLSLIAGITSV